jgi:hypothetical protein
MDGIYSLGNIWEERQTIDTVSKIMRLICVITVSLYQELIPFSHVLSETQI